MSKRHALWDALSRGIPANPQSADLREAMRRYNLVHICERFGWTPAQVATLPADFYHDLIQILNLTPKH